MSDAIVELPISAPTPAPAPEDSPSAKPKKARKPREPKAEVAATEEAATSSPSPKPKGRKPKKEAPAAEPSEEPKAAEEAAPEKPKKSRKRKSTDASSESSADSLTKSSDPVASVAGVSESSPAPDESASADAKKRKVEDENQLNKTMDTQLNLEQPGVAASKAPTLGTYLRSCPEQQIVFDTCLQKPKGVKRCDWDAIPREKRTLWVLYHKSIKDFKLDDTQFTFEEYLKAVEEEKQAIAELSVQLMAEIHARETRATQKLNKLGRLSDRHLAKALDNRATTVKVVKDLIVAE